MPTKLATCNLRLATCPHFDYHTHMYPEDRVLVAYVPTPSDFATIQQQGWYRIPQRHAPKGLYAEYYAFYFGQRFGEQKWAIHYMARRTGHELVTRLQLFPDQPHHPRAQDFYYKVQLADLQPLPRPIISLRWRRVTFIHTTWDRLQDATELNDLLLNGEGYVDRQFAALREEEEGMGENGRFYHADSP